MQKSTFLGKNCFESNFYKIDVYLVTNWSVRLEKHQTIEILLMVDFLRIFKILHFSKYFEIFETPNTGFRALRRIHYMC